MRTKQGESDAPGMLRAAEEIITEKREVLRLSSISLFVWVAWGTVISLWLTFSTIKLLQCIFSQIAALKSINNQLIDETRTFAEILQEGDEPCPNIRMRVLGSGERSASPSGSESPLQTVDHAVGDLEAGKGRRSRRRAHTCASEKPSNMLGNAFPSVKQENLTPILRMNDPRKRESYLLRVAVIYSIQFSESAVRKRWGLFLTSLYNSYADCGNVCLYHLDHCGVQQNVGCFQKRSEYRLA